jgi:hypothetical protein
MLAVKKIREYFPIYKKYPQSGLLGQRRDFTETPARLGQDERILWGIRGEHSSRGL